MVARSEVWWVDLGEPRGSEPPYQRPALILSADSFNRSRIATVIVAVVTTSAKAAKAPGNVALPIGPAGLDRASVVNVSQLRTRDRSYLSHPSGMVASAIMTKVDAGLRLALQL